MKTVSRFSLWVILASATLSVMAGSIIAPVLNLMREGLGVDPAAAGLIITTHSLFIALLSPLVGNLIDRLGTKKLFVFGLVLYGLAGGSGLLITSYWILLISRALLGAGAAAFAICITVMILNLYKGEERDRVMGWRGSANSLGAVIWPLTGGFLGGFSWHLPFAVYLLGIPLALLALITVPDIPRQETDHEESAGQKSSVLKVLRSNPILFAIYGLTFLLSVLLYDIVVFLPQLLARFGISEPSRISLFIAAMALAGGLTSSMYGRIRSVLSYKMIVLIALALWAVGFTVISQASSSSIIAAAVVLFGIGQGVLLPALMVWVGEVVEISFRGRVVSYLTTFGFLGQFSAPVIFSPVVPLQGLGGVFLIGGGICALLFVVFLVGLRE
jgi:ACDE family multidrug resistance protein